MDGFSRESREGREQLSRALAALPKEKLVALILEAYDAASVSPHGQAVQSNIEAAAFISSAPDARTAGLREAFESLLGREHFIGYRESAQYASAITTLLNALENTLLDDAPEEALRLCEWMLEREEECKRPVDR